MSYKMNDRFSLSSLETGDMDKSGSIFLSNEGMNDLSDVDTVLTSVDTVRQLYNGKPSIHRIDFFERLCNEGVQIVSDFFDFPFHLSKMGKKSGYRFKLQSNELGIVILFAGFYRMLDQFGSHLKIELSPKFIDAHDPEFIQSFMDSIASQLMLEFEYSAVALHLATDVQGWQPSDLFLDNFVTHSRTFKVFDGISEIDLSDISLAATRYGGKGHAKNFLIGKPSALQLCIYDKTKEIKVSDKVDYFQQKWNEFSIGTYDKDKIVTRIELRFYHKIIKDIGEFLGTELKSYLQASKYLTEIWRYGLVANRLMLNSDYIDPFWQYLIQDCFFYNEDSGIEIKRKKKQDVSSVGRNYTAILGNVLSVMARNPAFSEREVYVQLKRMTFFDDMVRYYAERGIDKGQLIQNIKKGLSLRRLVGKAA